MSNGVSENDRQRHLEFAEALEEDAEFGDDTCMDLVEAAGYRHLADDHERELALLERARELDVDAGPLSARGAYLAHLLTHGRGAEAEPLLAEARKHPQIEHFYLEVANAHAAIGDRDQALRWLNIGISRLLPELRADIHLELDRADAGVELLITRADVRGRGRAACRSVR